MHPFATDASEAVSSLGEVGLIREMRRWLGKVSPPSPHGIGDDCAVLPVSRNRSLVTVDPVIYGEHFDDAVPPAAAGGKLFKRNLSDIAAMGGRPRAAVVAIALDERVKVAWLEGFYRGLAAIGRRYGVPIVGGDVAHHKGGLVVTLTLIGEATGRRVLSRAGARPGDRLFVSGRLGGSLQGHHLSFTPRLAEGAWLAARPDVRALTDLSDGLAKDVRALTPSGTRPVVYEDAVPVSAAARASARSSGRSPLDHALDDGEDYELLFAVSRKTPVATFEQAWRRRFRTPVSCIGEFRPVGEPSPAGAIDLGRHHGFEHLKA